MGLRKNTLRSLFDAVRRVFFPTPEEKAEQARAARIQADWNSLRDAVYGVKLVQDDEPDLMASAMVLSGYGVVHAPYQRELIDEKEQEMRIAFFTNKLVEEGASEADITAFIEDVRDRIANPKKGLEFHM